MSALRERREWFEAQPVAARFEAARRFAIVQAVYAHSRKGLTSAEAVEKAAADAKVSAITVRRWFDAAAQTPAGFQLYALCPRRGQTGLKRRNPTRRIA